MGFIDSNQQTRFLLLHLSEKADTVVDLEKEFKQNINSLEEAHELARKWLAGEGEDSHRPYFNVGTRVVEICKHINMDSDDIAGMLAQERYVWELAYDMQSAVRERLRDELGFIRVTQSPENPETHKKVKELREQIGMLSAGQFEEQARKELAERDAEALRESKRKRRGAPAKAKTTAAR